MTWLHHSYDIATKLCFHGFTMFIAPLDHVCNMTVSSACLHRIYDIVLSLRDTFWAKNYKKPCSFGPMGPMGPAGPG